eukprot:g6548.t1
MGGVALVVHPLQPRKPFARVLDRAQLLIPIVSDALYRLYGRNAQLFCISVFCHIHGHLAQDTSMDFDASRIQQPIKVVTGAPVTATQPVQSSPFTANISSAQQFPSLGGAAPVPVASAWANRPATVITGSSTAPVTPAQPVTMSQPVLTPSPAPQPVLRQVVQSAVPAVASTPTVPQPQPPLPPHPPQWMLRSRLRPRGLLRRSPRRKKAGLRPARVLRWFHQNVVLG